MGLQNDRAVTATINAPNGYLIETSSGTSGQINFKTTESGMGHHFNSNNGTSEKIMILICLSLSVPACCAPGSCTFFWLVGIQWLTSYSIYRGPYFQRSLQSDKDLFLALPLNLSLLPHGSILNYKVLSKNLVTPTNSFSLF